MAAKLAAYVRRNHLGLIAIFIALGGTAYAANKVGSNDIAKNAVRSKHIKAKQVRPGDVSPALREICPAGTARRERLCVQPIGQDNVTFEVAHITCARADLRMPSRAESEYLGENVAIPGIGPLDDYWVDAVTDGDGSQPVAIKGADGNGSVGVADVTSESSQTLCVTDPLESG